MKGKRRDKGKENGEGERETEKQKNMEEINTEKKGGKKENSEIYQCSFGRETR